MIVFIEFYFCWIINFSCDLPQIVNQRQNNCSKMVFYNLNIFLWCQVGNFIAKNFNLCLVFLNKFLDFCHVCNELFLDFNKFVWLGFKLSKQNLIFNFLIFLVISLQIFSVRHFCSDNFKS